ncbi:MAG: UbiA family prenyltransferase [Methylococcaceae bacterium]
MRAKVVEERSLSLGTRWWIFVQERFPLGEHLVSILFLVLANAIVAIRFLETTMNPGNIVIALIVSLLFFFRLRCFDEVKDFDIDNSINQDRPLPRGLLTVKQVKEMFVCLTLLEIGLVSLIGSPAVVVHLLAVAYSYLMYKEFFIGKYLSPHLTTYAVTHTFVSVLVGYSIYAQVLNRELWFMPKALLIFGFCNWALFNLFEFARKTYAKDEEREGIDTYSSLFRPIGAVLLSISQIIAAVALLGYLAINQPSFSDVISSGGLYVHFCIVVIVLAAGVIYVAHPIRSTASLFRTISSAYFIIFYLVIVVQGSSLLPRSFSVFLD